MWAMENQVFLEDVLKDIKRLKDSKLLYNSK